MRKKKQPRLKKQKAAELIIGRSQNQRDNGMGFTAKLKPEQPSRNRLIRDNSENHMLAVAPTGAGKGRNVLIPNLLHWTGPAIVVDVKGEAAAVTARYRKEVLKQEVHILDPFGVVTAPGESASFDPLDAMRGAGEMIADEAMTLAALFSDGRRSEKERFWDDMAESLIAGLLVYLATCDDDAEPERSLARLWDIMLDQDVSYELAVKLDKGQVKNTFAYQQIAGFLNHEGEKVRSSVRSVAQHHLKVFSTPPVQRAVAGTSFDLDKLRQGKPMTIYIVIPPTKLDSHAPLVRLWLSMFMLMITERNEPPEQQTLLMIDEVHTLGPMPLVKSAVTLMRGYGLRAMLFMQDLSQLYDLFPRDADTVIANCDVMTFGHKNLLMSKRLEQIMSGLSAERMFAMQRGEMAIQQAGRQAEVVDRLDYLKDRMFKGRFDDNPRIGGRQGMDR